MIRRKSVLLARLGAFIGLVILMALPGSSPGQDTQGSKQTIESPTFEQKVVSFGTDQKENTRKLDDLTSQGWEYVGPLGIGMTLFKRTLANLVDFSKNQDFRIVNVNSGKVLDVAGGSTENLAKMVQTTYTGAGSQHWRLVRIDGSYKIINRKSGKALDVPDRSKERGIQIGQWSEHGEPNQQWIFEKIGKAFRVKSVWSGLVLDVERESKDDGARVLQWGFHGTENQLWELVLVKSESEPPGTDIGDRQACCSTRLGLLSLFRLRTRCSRR